jgi:hypothetical protein
MGLVADLLLSVPLAIIYCVFILKLTDVMYSDLPYNDRWQKSLVTLFIAGVVGIVIARTIFSQNTRTQNKIIRDGLTIGGIILVLYPTLTYWDKMANEGKLVVIGIALGWILWYSYRYYG